MPPTAVATRQYAEEHAETLVKLKHLMAVTKATAAQVAEAIEQSVAPLRERILKLEQRCDQLEAMRLSYTGVHEPGREYRRGEVCTSDGSMWYCRATTRTEPPGDHWQCCVKRGRDAKPARAA